MIVHKKSGSRPIGDETLPSGSIVHWDDRDPEDRHKYGVTCGLCGERRFTRPYINRRGWSGFCTKCSVVNRRKRGEEPHDSGTVIHWSERDPNDPTRTAITCHRCGKKCFDLIKIISTSNWSGRCFECRQTVERTQDELLPSGSIIHWGKRDPENPNRYGVTCGVCKGTRSTQIKRGTDLSKWAAFCVKCTGLRRRKHGDEKHLSGSIIHWNNRDPEDPHWRIGITCHRCVQDSYVHKQNTRSSTWRGLCSNCLGEVGLPNPRRLTGRQALNSGAVVDWDDRDPKDLHRRMVECPNFSSCHNKEYKAIDAGNKNKQPFYCRECRGSDRSSRLAGAWNAAKSANGGNKREKRPRGPAPGSYATITEDSLRRSFEMLGPYATQEKVAEFLAVTDRGIRDWQTSRKLKWRQVQQQYSQTGSS
jgi:hypothetical protein